MYIGGGPSLPAHYPTAAERKATMDALRMNICDAKTRLASVILRARTEGVPLDYMLRLTENPNYPSETQRTGVEITTAIYRSKKPVHVVAKVRKDCLKTYGLKAL